MTLSRSRAARRTGFTLVEMLVVIAIIAILIALLSSAVMHVFAKIPEIQTRTDISQLDSALTGGFMKDYGLDDPPPSFLVLREDLAYNMSNTVEARSFQFLRRAFGTNLGAGAAFIDWNGNGTKDGPHFLTGEQVLIFCVGGIPLAGSPNSGQGFSTNNANPAQPGGKRNGPYMNFDLKRLGPPAAPNANSGPSPFFFVYYDAYPSPPGVPQPYLYFSTGGINNGYSNDCYTANSKAYRTPGGVFLFPNKYQIISLGRDHTFGSGVWDPTNGAVGNDADNQANFTGKTLAAGQS